VTKTHTETDVVKTKEYTFSGKTVPYYFGEQLGSLHRYADPASTILIVDDRVNHFHGDKLKQWRKIIVQGNETSKGIGVLESVIGELISLESDRKTMLIGIGGGVVTDLTGFVASIYMRGVPYAFIPSTLLAQVDASIGGKNGINFGAYKNMLGVIRQPEFILFSEEVLGSLPDEQWCSGFAEIIKSACICDEALFDFLETNRDKALSHDRDVIAEVVERSADIKSLIVQEDEFENGPRRLLNFGHTVGHAVEKLEGIAHGQAVAKGMTVASAFSTGLSGLEEADRQRVVDLISDYGLPTRINSDPEAIARYFRMDKKREGRAIHFVLLEKIGRAVIKPLSLELLSGLLAEALQAKQTK
jgi:3-dehydroquinate synthase